MRKLILLAVFFSFTVDAAELTGIVTEVQDGDSLTLVNWQATYKIRLADIDAPEWKQERGKDSRASLFHLCGLKKAKAETIGADRYGRTLARVTCAGVDANAEQVRRGWAWVFIRYAPRDSPLYRLEAEARSDKLGLWADDEPMPPWDWRAAQ
jgi:endonuclease YncB( thermonuclease family)